MPVSPFVNLLLGLVNIGALIALLVLFFTQWKRMKSPFTAGLLLFATAFLANDLLRLTQLAGRLTQTRLPIGELDFATNILQLFAVGTLLYVVTR